MTVRQLSTRGGHGSGGLAGAWGRVCCSTLEVRGRKLTLADADAARQSSRIVGDPVVGNLNVLTPTVHEDAAASVGAVGDPKAIDARRIAPEAARERIRPCVHASAGRKQRSSIREAGEESGIPWFPSVEVRAGFPDATTLLTAST